MQLITPSEAIATKIHEIPEEVFEVVNGLITETLSVTKNWASVTVKQEDILEKLEERGLNRNEVINRKWLDFEKAYRKAGWTVTYNGPSYNETYPATFKFSSQIDS